MTPPWASAVIWVRSLVGELPHAPGTSKKKKKNYPMATKVEILLNMSLCQSFAYACFSLNKKVLF